MDQTEVSNLHWIEFLHYVQQDSSQSFYERMLPDSTTYPTSTYLVNSNFRQYPLIGVTYEQAMAYCIWKSRAVADRYQVNITYRLPSESELILTMSNFCRKQKAPAELSMVNDGKGKIKNVIGNISELTTEKGVVFGENYLSKSENEAIDASKGYAWIGFRCVAIYLNE